LLLAHTAMPVADVAAAAGLTGRAGQELVRGAAREAAPGPGPLPGPVALRLRLPFTPPLCPDNLFGHLAATAVPGIEEWRSGAYRRTLRLPHGHAVVALAPGDGAVDACLRLSDERDLAAALDRCRAVLDLDADPMAVDAHLGAEAPLAALVAAAPGRRVPRTVDAEELALRAVLGQQVSTAAARTHAGRLVAAHGRPLRDPDGGLTHLWPSPAELAGLDPETLALPRTRRRTVTGLVAALAGGAVDLAPGHEPDRARAQLGGLAGIGPWTVEVVAMRGSGDPDAFCATDLGVLAAAHRLGLPATPAALTAAAGPWRPWRAYAVQHLWATLDHAVNRLPGGEERTV
jgi:AraC family transcriptional regulator of adaptative response / DNA-3-methyladenine glycosylase II